MGLNFDLDKKDFERKLEALKDIIPDIACMLTVQENEVLQELVDEYECHLESTITEMNDKLKEYEDN